MDLQIAEVEPVSTEALSPECRTRVHQENQLASALVIVTPTGHGPQVREW